MDFGAFWGPDVQIFVFEAQFFVILNKRKSLFIQQTFHLNENISNLLSLMKIDLDNINSFLNPDIKTYLQDPYILKDMEKSVEKIYEKIISQQKIGIIADYDVDGSTSAALIIKFFELINVKYHLEIPDRINEGFGPNKRIIDNFKNMYFSSLQTLENVEASVSQGRSIIYLFDRIIRIQSHNKYMSEIFCFI